MAPRGSPGPWRRTDREVAEALQRLVWQGKATSDGLGFPRAGGLAAAASASAASGQTPLALAAAGEQPAGPVSSQ